MAKSKAQKIRSHKVRNGLYDPTNSRGIKPSISTHERKLPTLTERKRKQESKHKNKYTDY